MPNPHTRHPDPSPQELLTAQEAADALYVSVKTLYRWIAEDKLIPSVKTPGGKYRFRPADLARVMTDHQRAELDNVTTLIRTRVPNDLTRPSPRRTIAAVPVHLPAEQQEPA